MATRTTEEDPFLYPCSIFSDFTFSNMSMTLDENVEPKFGSKLLHELFETIVFFCFCPFFSFSFYMSYSCSYYWSVPSSSRFSSSNDSFS